MSSREPARLANAVARGWLVAASLALLLPSSARLGFWLPLHLALAGAVSAAMSGNMITFAWALTATPNPDLRLVRIQLTLMSVGAALIAAGYPRGHSAWVALGGTFFVAGACLLLALLASAWRRSLNRRHRFPMVMYAAAVVCVLAGGTIGAVIGSGGGGSMFGRLRQAHMALNVLGWASITVVATLPSLLPTVLRMHMPRWHAWRSGVFLALGLIWLAIGLAIGVRAIAGVGALAYWIGQLHLADLVIRSMLTPRKWPPPAAARHMVLGVAWFVVGGLILSWEAFAGTFVTFVPAFEVIFVCGWLLQILLGAWLYLLPTIRPGDPEDRRRWFTAVDLGMNAQVMFFNAGLVLVALRAGHVVGAMGGRVGAVMAIAAGALALAKTWAFPAVARIPYMQRRSSKSWRL